MISTLGVFRRLLLTVGIALIGVSVYGLTMAPRDLSDLPTAPIPGYHTRSLELSSAMSSYKNLLTADRSPEQKARELFTLLSDSFIHAPRYEIRPWDNWYLWGRAQFNRSFLFTQDTDLLWKRGGGFCVQASMIYADKAHALGLDSRIALLTGHVVNEVMLPSIGWRVVDTDLGIFWDESLESLQHKGKVPLIISTIVARGFSNDYAAEIAGIITSAEDNSLASFPMNWSRYAAEQVAAYIKWLVPALLILVGVLLRR